MKIKNIFSLGNLSLSVLGHVGILLIVIAISSIAPADKVIAPDHIKIMEIDLKDVKITGLETKLRNIEKQVGTIKAIQKKKETEGKDKGKAKPQPIIKTIKVDRETSALERTMTVSVVDALRIAMTRCWSIDTGRRDMDGIRAVAHIRLFPNGRVQDYWLEEESRQNSDPVFAYVLETIRFAIDACQPFSMLPVNEYEKWKSVQLTFFPTNKTVE